MTRALRGLAILTAVLALTAAALAQSGGGTGDPVSGTWTGSVGPGATPNYSITMKLAFDGKAAVSGTAQGAEPGDSAVVKSGTLDPQTGALKLELAIRDGAQTATFDGTVVLDTAAGRLTLSNQPGPGTFLLRKGSAVSSIAGSAPAAAPATSAALKSGFDELRGWILKSAEMVPEVPAVEAVTVRTFGQLYRASWTDRATTAAAPRQKVEWTDTTEKGKQIRPRCCPGSSNHSTLRSRATARPPPLFANSATVACTTATS
jgi:hypothetical protein